MAVPPPRRRGKEVSSRKLAASLWKSAVMTDCEGGFRWQCGLSDGLGFEFCRAASIPDSCNEGATKWDAYGDANSIASASTCLNKCSITTKKLIRDDVSERLMEKKARAVMEDLCIQQSKEIQQLCLLLHRKERAWLNNFLHNTINRHESAQKLGLVPLQEKC